MSEARLLPGGSPGNTLVIVTQKGKPSSTRCQGSGQQGLPRKGLGSCRETKDRAGIRQWPGAASPAAPRLAGNRTPPRAISAPPCPLARCRLSHAVTHPHTHSAGQASCLLRPDEEAEPRAQPAGSRREGVGGAPAPPAPSPGPGPPTSPSPQVGHAFSSRFL